MDDSQKLEQNWPALREKLRREYPQLSEDDLTFERGKEEEMLLNLQAKLNKTKQEIRNWLHIMG